MTHILVTLKRNTPKERRNEDYMGDIGGREGDYRFVNRKEYRSRYGGGVKIMAAGSMAVWTSAHPSSPRSACSTEVKRDIERNLPSSIDMLSFDLLVHTYPIYSFNRQGQ